VEEDRLSEEEAAKRGAETGTKDREEENEIEQEAEGGSWGPEEVGEVLDGLTQLVPQHLVGMFSGSELKNVMEEGGGRRPCAMDEMD